MKKTAREKRMDLERKATERQIRVNRVLEAIRDRKVTLDTAFGKYVVSGYQDDGGWVHAYPEGRSQESMSYRSFMVTLEELEKGIEKDQGEFKIFCQVWGGVTGHRESYLKDENGIEKIFKSRKDAEREAVRLNQEMNRNPYQTAVFRYSVQEIFFES